MDPRSQWHAAVGLTTTPRSERPSTMADCNSSSGSDSPHHDDVVDDLDVEQQDEDNAKEPCSATKHHSGHCDDPRGLSVADAVTVRPVTTTTMDACPPAKPPGKKRGRKKTRKTEYLKNPKLEITDLRNEVAALEARVEELTTRKRQAFEHFSMWQKLAHEQAARSQATLRENQKLRLARDEYEAMRLNLLKVLSQPCPAMQELGSVEENEWRMNVLSLVPERRRYNAERIIRRLYDSLNGYAISSGLVDCTRDRRSWQRYNFDAPDQVIRLQLSSRRTMPGHFRQVANHVWTKLRVPQLRSSSGVVVTVSQTEALGQDLHSVISTLHRPQHSRATANQQLHSRLDDPRRSIILIKSVADQPLPAGTLLQSSDGWFSFEPGQRDQHGQDQCVMRSSLSFELSPMGMTGSARLIVDAMATNCHARPVIAPEVRARFSDEVIQGHEARLYLCAFAEEMLVSYTDYIEAVARDSVAPIAEICTF